MRKHVQLAVILLSLLGLAVMFLFGADVYLNQLPNGAVTGFKLYALAFTTGVWSTLTVLFIINYISVYRWDRLAVGLDPRLD